MIAEFDLHGLVRVRLIDPPTSATAAVTADTGMVVAAPTAGSADIVVEYVDDLALAHPLRRVGTDAGFASHEFVLGVRAGTRTVFPIGSLGGPIRLRCERGVANIPHLQSLLNLSMLTKGALPVHGSAVVHDGRGLLVTGWAEGGKTEVVLALMAMGASFVADDWCFVVPGQQRILGLQHPVQIWDWELDQLPAVAATLTSRQRARIAVSRRLARLPALTPVLAPTLGAAAPPAQVFGPGRILDTCSLDLLVLAETHDDTDVVVRKASVEEVRSRVATSVQAERAPLDADVLRWRFAFPGQQTPLLDATVAREASLLEEAFAGTTASLVSHPRPVDLATLGRAVAGLR